jgi:hypothetical protein
VPAPPPIAFRWIRELAAPYLRGYRPVAEQGASLCGFWFLTTRKGVKSPGRGKNVRLGFFVGYILRAEEFVFLAPEPPECAVWVVAAPARGTLHRRLAARPESLLRRTFGYIRLLTHRPPRFSFHAEESAVMVRHTSMREWPPSKYEHFSRNFFIETLAWLVRSGVVSKLPAELARLAVGPGR